MLHVDDHIDDLFRRAAEDYPLNTEGANFDKVLAGLQDDQDNKGHHKHNFKPFLHLLWLLLLVPLPWLCNKEQRPEQVEATALSTTGNKPQPETAPTAAPRLTKPDASVKTHPGSTEAVQPTAASISTTKSSKTYNQKVSYKTRLFLNRANSRTTGTVNEQTARSTISPVLVPSSTVEKQPGQDLVESRVPSIDTLVKRLQQPAQTADNSATLLTSTDKHNEKQPRFYAGLMAGSDISFIKFQKVKDPGLSIGLVTGYTVSKRFAVEASAFLEKKSYFSTGEYFNKQRTSIPANYKIETLWGKCNMIDIAVNARYNVVVKPKANWFLTAGLSSYIMKKEDYYYTYRYNWQIMQRRLSYKNSTNNFLSMANMSIGYSGKFQGKWQFRVEPFVKVPLTGVGIGDLSIMSAGINAGFTRPLF